MSFQPPQPNESQSFQFKAFCRLKVFQCQEELYKRPASLIAAASKFGLIFVGTPQGIQVLQSTQIYELDSSSRETAEYPHREIPLPSAPTHLSVNCDQTQLAVGLCKEACPVAIIYDITSFCSKNVTVVVTVRLSASPGNVIQDLQFNPGLPGLLAACTSDGGVGVYELKVSGLEVNTLPPAAHASCLCWSPKGKQLVVGDQNGVLTQYKPDLKGVKNYPPPPDKQNSSLVNVLWISNFQFAAIYADKNPNERPGLVIVNVPKNQPISYVNFEDICYSGGDYRNPQFYLIHEPKWNNVLMASANSIEVAVLGLMPDQQWQQLIQMDSARAELPLSSNRQETYPLGIALESSSIKPYPWGENQHLPPMPVLHILSHDGVLCLFHVINIQEGAATLCIPPQPLQDTSGIDQFVIGRQIIQVPQPPQIFSQSPGTPTGTAALPQKQQVFNLPVETTFISSNTDGNKTFGQTPFSSATSVFGSGSTGGSALGFGSSSEFSSQGGISFAPKASPVSSSVINSPKTASGPVITSVSGGSQSLLDSRFANSSVSPAPSSPALTSISQVQKVSPSSSPLFSLAPKSLPPLVPIPKVQDNVHTSRQEVLEENEPASKKPEDSENKAMFMEMVQDEVKQFHNELEELKSHVTKEFSSIGKQTEKQALLQPVESLEQFIQELKSTQLQNSEIHSIRSVLMESFAWAEDAKYRQQQLNSPSYLQLVQSQKLDPVSLRHMSNVRQLFYYVESQLQEVDKHLDIQWGQYQDSMRDAKNRLYIPTMEEVYQTMVTHNNILAKQRFIVEDIAKRLTQRRRRIASRIPLISNIALSRNKGSSTFMEGNINNSARVENDLSKLAENLLEIKLGQKSKCGNEDTSDDGIALRTSRNLYRNIVNGQLRLNRKKRDILRESLTHQPTVHIKPDRTPLDIKATTPMCSFGSLVLTLPASSPTKTPGKQNITPGKTIEVSHPLKQDSSPTMSKLPETKQVTNFSTSSANTGFSFSVKPQNTVTSESASMTASQPKSTQASVSATKEQTTDKNKISTIFSGFPFNAPKAPEKAQSEVKTGTTKVQELRSPFSFTATSTSKVEVSTANANLKVDTSSAKGPLASLGTFVGNISPSPLSLSTVVTPVSTSAGNVFSFNKPVQSVKQGDVKLDTSKALELKSKASSDTAFAVKVPDSAKAPELRISQSSIAATPVIAASQAKSTFSTVTSSPSTCSSQTASPASLTVAASTVADSTTSLSMFSSLSFSPPSTAKTAATIFGGSTGSQTNKSIFGAPPNATIVFGSGTSSTAVSVSEPPTSSVATVVTSSLSTPAASAKSIFGTPNTSVTFKSSVFSSPATSSTPQATPLSSPLSIQSSTSSVSPPEPQKTAVPAATSVVTAEASSTSPLLARPILSQAAGTVSVSAPTPVFGATQTNVVAPASATDIAVSIAASSTPFTFALQGNATAGKSEIAQATVTSPVATIAASLSSPITTCAAPSSAFSFALSGNQAKTPDKFPLFKSEEATFQGFFGEASTAATTSTTVFPNVFARSATAPPATTSQSFFGQPICSPSSFGQNSIFGGKTTTTSAVFSSPIAVATTAPSLFGQSTFGSSPSFGQSGGPLFGQSGSSAFGSTGSVFGTNASSPSNIFGGAASSPSSTNLFQQAASNTTGSMFGAQPSSPSSSFSGGLAGNASAFGSSPSFQSRTVFGGAPSFSNPAAPAFGSPPAFGSSPVFGGAPAFSNPSTVFGASASAFGGGSTTQQNSTFEALASQDGGLMFGSLGQASQQPTQSSNVFESAPAFNSNSNTKFGGDAFTSWR